MAKLAERYKCSQKGFIEEASNTKPVCKLDHSKQLNKNFANIKRPSLQKGVNVV
jgi:hypothetical protein